MTKSRQQKQNFYPRVLFIPLLFAATSQTVLASQNAQFAAGGAQVTATILQVFPNAGQLAASVIAANPTATTYALACAGAGAADVACRQLNGVALTQGPSTFALTIPKTIGVEILKEQSEEGDGAIVPLDKTEPARVIATVSLAVDCALQGAGAGATCTRRYLGLDKIALPTSSPQNDNKAIANRLRSLQAPFIGTVDAGQLKYGPIIVTAGSEKLVASPSASGGVGSGSESVATPPTASPPSPAPASPPSNPATTSATSTTVVSTSASSSTVPTPKPPTKSSSSSSTPFTSSSSSVATAPAVTSTSTSLEASRSQVTMTSWIVPTGDAGVKSVKTTGPNNTTSTSGAESHLRDGFLASIGSLSVVILLTIGFW